MDLDEQSINPLTEIADLEDKGYRIVEFMAGDVVATEPTRRLLARLREEKKETFFSDVLFYLTSERFPEGQAQAMWDDIMNHKFLMSERVGRNVGVRVAAIDYFVNIRKLLHAPRVIKSSDFRQTVQMARTDALTGLFNRRYFIEQANRILEAASRLNASVILMMTDLDNFKKFNDHHGHQAGDLLLQEVARLVRNGVRNSDVVARYGGDEFALFLPKANKAESIPSAEKIRQKIEENCQPMGVTISIGLAQYPEDATNRDDLIAAADEVLYRAKEFGGNKICYFHPVVFRFTPDRGEVKQVSVVGDFNNWNREAHPLLPVRGTPEWQATVQLKPGRYRYKFLVNNAQWAPDPLARVFESDGFGGQCSVVEVR
jgi:diguanylate cyclase (GGDEF)-like protein